MRIHGPRRVWIAFLIPFLWVIPDAGSAAPELRFRQIAAAGMHTCGLSESGSVYCWGSNYLGQLGDGTTTDRDRPTAVVQGEGLKRGRVTALAAGMTHTCAVTDERRLFCWGYNQAGRLGDGTRVQSRPYPVLVKASGAFRQGTVGAITVGTRHTCASTADGWFCWGDNSMGQLGDGTTTDRPVPVRIPVPGGRPSQMSAGTYHTCALPVGGPLYCWGYNHYGQIGDGTRATRKSPTAVGHGGMLPRLRIRAVDAGYSHTCALTDQGVWCWGRNTHGQLGDGTNLDRAWPGPVRMQGGPRPDDMRTLRVGEYHNCLASASGRAYCWGDNTSGQLGNGGFGASTIPTPVTQVSGVTAGALRDLSTGSKHTCAVGSDGTASCWGSNENGRLGLGIPAGASPVPRAVAGPAGA